MTETIERHEFQAEVTQLLDLLVHSLYSSKDIFLRELISNASDALDKRRFEELTTSGDAPRTELMIRLDPNRDQRTLAVLDNGIGMTRDELVTHIGTMAKSGTKEFVAALKEAQTKEVAPELIGQFGVGFYSAFMVADRVSILTRRVGHPSAVFWESEGDGTYTVREADREEPGTTVTLHLKPVDRDQGLLDFTDEAVLRAIVKRYSDFVAYPIRMKCWRPDSKDASATKVLEDDTLNSMQAIWARPKGEVSEQEYREFYHHIAHDWSDPLRTLPVKMEGTIEADALLFIPAKAPVDLYSPEMKRGLQLYVKRVFIMDECRDLLPPFLRFVRGVVDAHDLSLNVSRELLQQDRQIQVIRRQLVKKVIGALEDLKRDDRPQFGSFWAECGPVLKEGLLEPDLSDSDRLLDLVVAPSTIDPTQLTSLEEYVKRMQPGQDSIYFLTGPSAETVAKSPLLEAFVDRGYEVLLFSDPVDELWLEQPRRYHDTPLRSVGRGEVALGSDAERQEAQDTFKAQERDLAGLVGTFRVLLQDDVKEVRLSQRLRSSPACLVGDEGDLSPRMQRLLEQMGQSPGKVKRILELNPTHPIVQKLQAIHGDDEKDPRLKLYAELLLGQAYLTDTGQVPDPAAFSQQLVDVMLRNV